MDQEQIGTDVQSTEEDSLRSQLEKAFEEHDVPSEEVSINRPRDEHGKFKRKDGQDGEQSNIADVESGNKNVVKEGDGDGGKAEVSAQGPGEITSSAPASWKAEVKAEWDKIPEAARKYITEREAEIHKGFTKFDEERTFGKQLKDVITPYTALIQSEGANPITAVQSLLNTANQLRNGSPQEKLQVFSQLAQHYGVDLHGVSQRTPQHDPQVHALYQEVQRLKGEREAEKAMAQQQEQTALVSEVERFAADKPHFETLKPMMAALLQNGQANDLQSAYDYAFRAHPETSQAWLDQELSKRAPVDAIRSKAAAAKNAAVSITGAPGSASTGTAPAATLREELERQFAKTGLV